MPKRQKKMSVGWSETIFQAGIEIAEKLPIRLKSGGKNMPFSESNPQYESLMHIWGWYRK